MDEREDNSKVIDWSALADGHPAKTQHLENMALAGFVEELESKMTSDIFTTVCHSWALWEKGNALHADSISAWCDRAFQGLVGY